MTKEDAWRKAKGYLYDALDGEEADEIVKALEEDMDFTTNGDVIKDLFDPRDDQIKTYGDWVEIEIQRQGINFSCTLEWWNAPCQPVKEAGRTSASDEFTLTEEGQESVIDKIRAEIERAIQEETVIDQSGGEYESVVSKLDPDDVFQIIDKYKAEISAESTTKNDLESDHTISTLDDFIDFGKKAFGVEITIKKSDNPDTYEKLFGAIKADCLCTSGNRLWKL